ncbi:MAG: helix-turn-helix domain-containing protein [Gloeobacteraceae cyanobacterium ES-bin-144]|nr:helix-turn-helix domain-containing protein [Verrucomicrobiales bacterium]
MRLIRYKDTWRAVETFSGKAYCLEILALSKSYRVSAVCSALGCSERLLYSVFMRDIGLPPKTWMSMERMVVARRKLEGGKAIEMVARELGFMAVETFTRRFYEVYGISPGRFVRSRKVFDPSKESLDYRMATSSKRSQGFNEEE